MHNNNRAIALQGTNVWVTKEEFAIGDSPSVPINITNMLTFSKCFICWFLHYIAFRAYLLAIHIVC